MADLPPHEVSAMLSPDLNEALTRKLLAMGDDELILAHRNSEWCGHAPILEEDIAFANIAQDELGHAGLWYDILHDLQGFDPDRLVFFRPAHRFRNARILERPNGDWAFSILRQYLFDSYEMILLRRLADSAYSPLGQAAAKARPEEIYHLRHTSTWVQRLGLGTKESNRRMQRALQQLWSETEQLFQPLENEAQLVEARILPPARELAKAWRDEVVPFLLESDLNVRQLDRVQENGNLRDRTFHTEHLQPLVETLQSVARSDPQASW